MSPDTQPSEFYDPSQELFIHLLGVPGYSLGPLEGMAHKLVSKHYTPDLVRAPIVVPGSLRPRLVTHYLYDFDNHRRKKNKQGQYTRAAYLTNGPYDTKINNPYVLLPWGNYRRLSTINNSTLRKLIIHYRTAEIRHKLLHGVPSDHTIMVNYFEFELAYRTADGTLPDEG